MKPELPRSFFIAISRHRTRTTSTAMVACFAPDAAVHDEGRDIIGTDAIRAWKQETSAKYRITAEPLECTLQDGRTIVAVKVSGTFDGSPANLTYRFGFSGEGRIGALEVR